jgi:hypothetical protein
MPTTTENYGLAKPGYEDPVDIEVINRNMDAIDAELARNADGEARLSIVTNMQILALFEEGEE